MCIDDTLSCHNVCLETSMYCLQQGGKHTEPNHYRLMLDCGELCETTANHMLRGSILDARLCEVCAEMCEKCAESCEQFRDDSRMLACAEICHRCAESCRRMVGKTKAAA
ncbi:MAG: four-helix bundle copper-binding protein [Actinobacteria bacterium]|nr:four-helix bundle copper-binding protein [Actinomycetota bacterium]